MIIPRKLDERGPGRLLRAKINELIGWIKSLVIVSTPNIRVSRTALGTIIEVLRTTEEVTAGRDIQRFKITSVSDDWVVCRKVDKDEAEVSTTDYKVMRPIKLRSDEALPSDYKEDSLVEDSSQERTFDRTINGTDYTVSQEIYPPYAIDDLIYGANKIIGGTEDDGTGIELEWIDLNVDGRHWQYSMREIEVCVNDAIKKAIAQISEGED